MEECWNCGVEPTTTERLAHPSCFKCQEKRITASAPKYRFGEIDDALALKMAMGALKTAFRNKK